MTQGDRINHLNSLLMVASCAAAFVMPFELFLLAYAVLGPLHYLTEISWIHDRRYFAGGDPAARSKAMLAWLVLVGLTLAVMIWGLVAERVLGRSASPVFEIGLFYLVLVCGALLVFRASAVVAAGVILVTGLGLAAFSGSPFYGLVAFLILTIVHVLVFTFVFLLQGALKSRSRSGMISVFVYLACLAAIFAFAASAQAVGDYVRRSYEPFEILNGQLIRLLGLGPGTALSDIYETPAGAIVMRLIAFAYTYHYLNWFTKTSAIGWNRIPRARALIIVAVWLCAVAVYAWDYLTGFAVLYALSALHVMLELPLNHQSFAGLAREAARRSRSENVPASPSIVCNTRKLSFTSAPVSAFAADARSPPSALRTDVKNCRN